MQQILDAILAGDTPTEDFANLQIPEAEIRTGSTLILTIIGIWILVVLSRPVTRFKGLVIGAMMIGLILVYSVPIARDFLQFTDPTLPTALLVLGTSVACIALIEIVRFVHRRVAYRDAQDALHHRVSHQRVSK